MKILDYITQMSIADKDLCNSDLKKFAKDINAEVFALDSDSVIVICDSKKINENLTSKDKYVMCVVGPYSKCVVKTAISKEDLIQDYADLVAKGVVQIRSSSSNIESIVAKNLRK